MDKLTITATMRTPVVCNGGYWTLDGLLAGVIFDQCQDVDTAHSTVPIKCTDGLFHASAAMMEPIKSEKIAFVAGLRADHSLDPDLIKKNKQGGLHSQIKLTKRKQFGNVMNTYGLKTAEEVTWYCEGDAERIQALLQDVSFIGKRRASGFGEVSHWSVDEGELDGITGIMGEPLRPVPVEQFKGDLSSIKADAGWRPAYWDPAHRAICYVPAEGL